jgi:hypothetical protein
MNVTFVLNGRESTVAMVHPLPLDRDKIELKTLINGMEWEDGSGESFILKGYALRIEGQDELISRPFEAYYPHEETKRKDPIHSCDLITNITAHSS